MNGKATPAKQEWHPRLLDDKGLNFEMLRIADIGIDHTYQRPLRGNKIAEMWERFNPDELTAIVVSRRADGSLWAVDGQHRLEILTRLGKSVFLADVREGLTVEEEANLFYRLNEGQTRVGSWDKFRARIRAKEPIAMAIRETVERHGFSIGRSTEHKATSATSALERSYEIGRLDKTMSIISAVWEHDAVAMRADIILGLSQFLYNYDSLEEYDDGQLLAQLDTVAPSAIIRRTKEIAIETGRSNSRGLGTAIAIRDAYNGLMTRGNRPKKRLEGAPIAEVWKTGRKFGRG